jgi:hypothetical protein
MQAKVLPRGMFGRKDNSDLGSRRSTIRRIYPRIFRSEISRTAFCRTASRFAVVAM